LFRLGLEHQIAVVTTGGVVQTGLLKDQTIGKYL
jgi:hypothetical protein